MLTKQEILLGRGTQVESRGVREPRRTALPPGCSLRFYGDGISFRVVFSQSFWLRVLSGGTGIIQPRWMLERRILGGGRTCVSPFDLSWTLPVGGGLLVPCSLTGPPVIKQLMQMVTMVPGQGGRFQCASPSSPTNFSNSEVPLLTPTLPMSAPHNRRPWTPSAKEQLSGSNE